MHDPKFVGTIDTLHIENLRIEEAVLVLILVYQGYHNKEPHMGGLNKRNSLFQFWILESLEIKASPRLVPSEGHKGTICPRPLSLAYI